MKTKVRFGISILLGWGVCFQSGGLHAQHPAPTHSASEVWSIGSIDGPPETLWSGIGSALILDDEIFVTDSRLREVRRFTLEGDFVGLLGGPGSGPGEFALPLYPTLEGDSLRVIDILNDRAVYFSRQGEHLGTFRLDFPVRSLQKLWTGQKGWTLGWTGLVGGRPSEDALPDHLIVAWPESGQRIDTIARVRGLPNMKHFPAEGEWDAYVTLGGGAQAGPAGGALMFGDTLAVIDGMASEVTLYALDEDGYRVSRTVALPGRPGEVSDTQVAYFNDEYFERFPYPASRADALILPDSFPAWSTVRADGASAWIERGGDRLEPTSDVRWTEWSPTTGIGRTVAIPAGVRALAFRYPWVVGYRTDPDYDVQSLVLFRMEPLGK